MRVRTAVIGPQPSLISPRESARLIQMPNDHVSVSDMLFSRTHIFLDNVVYGFFQEVLFSFSSILGGYVLAFVLIVGMKDQEPLK